MNILVINSGSSSIKYKLFSFPKESLVDKGEIEKIGEEKSKIKNHTQGIDEIINKILVKSKINSLKDITAVGHRVVHGGEKFKQPHLINKTVIKQIQKCSKLAPLHNPANLAGINYCLKSFPTNFQVAVFDTAFHQTVSEEGYIYPIPYKYYRKYKIRKYGFHGTSHQFIAQKAALTLKKPLTKLKLITAHLGNGCSMTAIDKGKSIATSMGFTPLEGLMMGTRCGDVDVAAIFNIMKKEKLAIDQMDKILNKKSGFLGVSGVSNDLRNVSKAAKDGNRRAKLAVDIFISRLKKYIGAYLFYLGGADAVCFTGGIGENNPDMVKSIKSQIKRIFSKTKVLIIPTDEELMIAKLTYKLFKKLRRGK
ncbi:MAG: acetate/propionate family kinase [Candidatus Omnitrophica bacterium]|nr:acetate/propionate family kinase [Candidatus Omnitrophota bacterium]MCF7894757.1 acetate/propionate family kinase [Candidatus Omnitrophota bacterium]